MVPRVAEGDRHPGPRLAGPGVGDHPADELFRLGDDGRVRRVEHRVVAQPVVRGLQLLKCLAVVGVGSNPARVRTTTWETAIPGPASRRVATRSGPTPVIVNRPSASVVAARTGSPAGSLRSPGPKSAHHLGLGG